MFERCMQSIEAQVNAPETNIIVSCDNSETLNYVVGYNCLRRKHPVNRPIMVTKQGVNMHPHFYTAPWNLYLNELIKCTKEGWVLILDDDDYLAHNNVLNEIWANVSTIITNTLLLTRMEWPTGRIIPGNDLFGKLPMRKHIGMPCFLWHTRQNSLVKFDGFRAGDFRMVLKLYNHIPNKILISNPIVKVGNTGLVGGKGK
jgi:hypothetical protein